MRNSLSLIASVDLMVDETVLRLSPEDKLPLAHSPRVVIAGRLARQCNDCRGFERVVTKTGVAVCSNPVHAEDSSPLPRREPGSTNPPKPRAAARPLSALAR
ncbi:hypothetical protein ACKI14_45030 [Streptomyces turgidiscabies]|uniref:hypothetical protein n=1 Tax=Streptomyces turgidiscabies TaxID=85558 RepID=UPI0038F686FB